MSTKKKREMNKNSACGGMVDTLALRKKTTIYNFLVYTQVFICKYVYHMNKKLYTEEEFVDAVRKSKSYSEVCRLIGLSPKGGNLKTVKNKIVKLGLDISHFTFQRWNKGLTSEMHTSIKKKPIEEILVENSGWSSHGLKLRLFREGVKEKRCERCGRTEWEGNEIPLELHHINGIHNDNRIENLQILCPNCHALTDNYSGKSSKR